MSDLYIVGGGTSLEGFDFDRLKNKTTMCVNMAVFDVPDPSYFITIDYVFFKKCGTRLLPQLIQGMPGTHKIFVANFASGHIDRDQNGMIYDTRFQNKYTLIKYMDEVISAKLIRGIGRDMDRFCTARNSGYSAIQYGLIKGYDNIYLLGIDLAIRNDKAAHYHDRYSKTNFGSALKYHQSNFNNLFLNYKKFFPNQNIYSCSPLNPLNGKSIEYVDIDTLV